MRAVVTRVLAPLAAVGLLLSGCTSVGEEGDETPVIVKEGEEFAFNGWTVADGWKIVTEQAAVEGQTYDQPNVQVTVTNDGESSRPTLFAFYFAQGEELLASINCTSSALGPGESADILCTGVGEEFPTGYDKIQVEGVSR